MKKHIKRSLVVFAGVFFLALGLVGLALPFLQGFLFITIGLILLSISSTRVRGWVEMHTRRFPKVHEGFEKIERWVTRIIGTVD
jgi:uncharacterized protein